jgi:hypothetical protein
VVVRFGWAFDAGMGFWITFGLVAVILVFLAFFSKNVT